MLINLKNKDTLTYDDFSFKCCIGKKGLTSKKIEGDKKTPKGVFSLGSLFYRKDRNKKPQTNIKKVVINQKMGWCDDILHNKFTSMLLY